MKQKNLNINKRDQQLLTILLAIVLMFLSYYFVAGPAYDKGKRLTEDLVLARESLSEARATAEKVPELRRDEAARRLELKEKYQLFLYNIDEANLLYRIDSLMIQTGFVAESYEQSDHMTGKIYFSPSSYVPSQYSLLEIAKELNPDLLQSETGTAEGSPGNDAKSLDAVEQMDITIGFSGISYNSIYQFLKSVEGLERSFILSNISVGDDPQITGLSGQLILRAISLPKIDEGEKNDLEFEPAVPKGKTSPF